MQRTRAWCKIVTWILGMSVPMLGALSGCAERPPLERAQKACLHLAELGRNHAASEQVKATMKDRKTVDKATLEAEVAKLLAEKQAAWKKTLAANQTELDKCAEGFVSLGTKGQVDCILKSTTKKNANACRKAR